MLNIRLEEIQKQQDRQDENINCLEQELAEVKKQSVATLMTSTDLGLNSATNMQTLLMTVTDLGLKLGELERQLKEMGVNE